MFRLIALINAVFHGLQSDINYLMKSFDFKIKPGEGRKGFESPCTLTVYYSPDFFTVQQLSKQFVAARLDLFPMK
jgi:hypothetical protein